VEIEPGSLWYAVENRCTYEVLDEPSKFGADMVLAVILTSARKARGRYGACPLKGDRVYVRREDFGDRLQPVELEAG
jgi:hypothetical protein